MPSAKGELKNYTRIWNPLMEAIRKANLGSAEFRVLMALLYRSYGFRQTEAEMSYRDWSAETGMPKPTISRVVKALRDKGVIEEVDPPTFRSPGRYRIVKDFRRWKQDVIDISCISDRSMRLLEEECGANDNCSRDEDSYHGNNSYYGVNSNSSHGDNSEEPIFPVTTPDSGALQENKQEKEVVVEDHLATEHVEDTAKDARAAFDEIEDRMRMRMGEGRYILVGEDFRLAKVLLDSGIPLPFVLDGIDWAFQNYRPKYPKDKIRSFAYCHRVIEKLWRAEDERRNAKFSPRGQPKTGPPPQQTYGRAIVNEPDPNVEWAKQFLRQHEGDLNVVDSS